MDETPAAASGLRRNEDIALDLMKFVAMTTGYGRTSSSGVGFQGSGAAAKPEEYAAHLLELHGSLFERVSIQARGLRKRGVQVSHLDPTVLRGAPSNAQQSDGAEHDKSFHIHAESSLVV